MKHDGKFLFGTTGGKKKKLICLSITVSRSTTCYSIITYFTKISENLFSFPWTTTFRMTKTWFGQPKGTCFGQRTDIFCTTNRRNFEVTIKQIRENCFMNEHMMHATCCQKPVAVEWPRKETTRHAYMTVVRCHDTRQPFCRNKSSVMIVQRIPVAARSKDWVCGRSFHRIVGLNPVGGMDVCLLWVLCVAR